jgi:hypothetical protein
MKPAVVGWRVGFLVGKSGLPDMNRPNGMNNLTPDCREWRVSIGEETARGFRDSAPHARGKWLSLFIFLDLNDARTRR